VLNDGLFTSYGIYNTIRIDNVRPSWTGASGDEFEDGHVFGSLDNTQRWENVGGTSKSEYIKRQTQATMDIPAHAVNPDITVGIQAKVRYPHITRAVLYYRPITAGWIQVEENTANVGGCFNFSWSPGVLPEGVYDFKVDVFDAIGTQGTATIGPVTIDRAPPAINMDVTPHVLDGTNTLIPASGMLEVEMVDNSWIKQAIMRCKDDTGTVVLEEELYVSYDTSGTGIWSGTLELTRAWRLAGGTVMEIEVECTDAVGFSATATMTVHLDTSVVVTDQTAGPLLSFGDSITGTVHESQFPVSRRMPTRSPVFTLTGCSTIDVSWITRVDSPSPWNRWTCSRRTSHPFPIQDLP